MPGVLVQAYNDESLIEEPLSTSYSPFDLVEMSGDLNTSREGVFRESGPTIPLVALPTFIEEVLPPTASANVVTKVLKKLEDAKVYRDGGWKAFPVDPADATGENKVFKGLVEIATAVQAAVEAVTQQTCTVQLVHDPNRSPVCVMRETKSQTDGCFVLRQALFPNKPHWMDVALTGEYKRKDNPKDINDDIKKVLWNMHHIMREDARRRFCYSFTVENRSMRLWYASRAEFLVSDAFDFIEEPRRLVEFFVSVMLATPEQLGWDPTMNVVEIREKDVVYDITVFDDDGRPQRYRTVELVSNSGTLALRGRGTRVWKVQKLGENGELLDGYMALKDNWIDITRRKEHQNLDSIRGEAKADKAKQHLVEAFEVHLLHYDCAGEVVINGEKDRTHELDKRKVVHPPPYREFDLIQSKEDEEATARRTRELERRQSEMRNVVFNLHDHETRQNDKSYTYGPRCHYRIVFKELCTPLNALEDPRVIFLHLARTATALKALHEAGWVHRDLSPANIFIFGDVVKLADLEYAKRVGEMDGTVHELRTGTMAFTAPEACCQTYDFTPRPSANEDIEETADLFEQAASLVDPPKDAHVDELARSDIEDAMAHRFTAGTGERPLTTWRYNPLHDIESLWWMMAYYAFYKDYNVQYRDKANVPPDTFRRYRLASLHEYSFELFGGGINVAARGRVHSSLDAFESKLRLLHPCMQGAAAQALNKAHIALIDYYHIAERLLPQTIGYDAVLGLHRKFTGFAAGVYIRLDSIIAAVEMRPLSQVINEERISLNQEGKIMADLYSQA